MNSNYSLTILQIQNMKLLNLKKAKCLLFNNANDYENKVLKFTFTCNKYIVHTK